MGHRLHSTHVQSLIAISSFSADVGCFFAPLCVASISWQSSRISESQKGVVNVLYSNLTFL